MSQATPVGPPDRCRARPDFQRLGYRDAFVAKVSAIGDALIYCGYIGGAGIHHGYGIAVDRSGSAYVAGYTQSTRPGLSGR